MIILLFTLLILLIYAVIGGLVFAFCKFYEIGYTKETRYQFGDATAAITYAVLWPFCIWIILGIIVSRCIERVLPEEEEKTNTESEKEEKEMPVGTPLPRPNQTKLFGL